MSVSLYRIAGSDQIPHLSPEACEALVAYRAWQARQGGRLGRVPAGSRVTRHLHRDGWTSAATLGATLGISAKDAASAVSYARSSGAPIETDRKRGYRLTGEDSTP